MSNILVRDLNPSVVGRLKAIAKRHGRSLQKEVKAILTEAASFLAAEAASASVKWQTNLSGRVFRNSADSIREDRGR